MKTTLLTTLFVLCFLTTAALGQSAVGFASTLSSEPQILRIPSHDLHASQSPMAVEQNLLITSCNTSAHGERPLWEVSKPAPEVPLGDVARLFRNQHATVKKAVMVLEK
jgi:hypothetical protein